MKPRSILAAVVAASAPLLASAADGLIAVKSPHSAQVTMNRLEAIVKERVRYLIEGNLYGQLLPDARKHLNQLFLKSPGANLNPKQREARLSNWEETYFKAIKTALEALPE